MANWIKVLNTLPRSRAVFALARALRCKRHAALGLAVEWLCWLDEHSSNGETGMLDAEISDMLGWQGAAEALSSVGWVSHDEQGYVFAVDFEAHNGETSKRRAIGAKRVERCRMSRAERDNCNGDSVTNVTGKALPEKRREDKEEDSPNGEPSKKAAGGGGARPSGAGEVLAVLMADVTIPLNDAAKAEVAAAFFDSMESVGWVDARGRNIWAWEPAARAYARKWAANEARPATGSARRTAPPQYGVRVDSSRKGGFDD